MKLTDKQKMTTGNDTTKHETTRHKMKYEIKLNEMTQHERITTRNNTTQTIRQDMKQQNDTI